MGKKDITPNELRAEFLREAKPVMDAYLEVAKGNGAMKGSKEIHGKVWDVLSSVILQADDLRKIRINQHTDILRLLRRGKITISEAKELMAIMKDMFEVTELPKMMEKLEEITQSKA